MILGQRSPFLRGVGGWLQRGGGGHPDETGQRSHKFLRQELLGVASSKKLLGRRNFGGSTTCLEGCRYHKTLGWLAVTLTAHWLLCEWTSHWATVERPCFWAIIEYSKKKRKKKKKKDLMRMFKL